MAESTWEVTYRARGSEHIARRGLTHDGACQFADKLEREGWKHVTVRPEDPKPIKENHQ